MSQLFDKSMQTLELNRVLDLLSDCAATEEGKERALSLRPMTDLDDVRHAQEETTAAVNMLLARGTPSFSGVHPVAASLQLLICRLLPSTLTPKLGIVWMTTLFCLRDFINAAFSKASNKSCLE